MSIQGEHRKARARGPGEISIRGAYKVTVYKDCCEDIGVCGCQHARGAGIIRGPATGVWDRSGKWGVAVWGSWEELHLACRAVGHAGTAIATQIEVGGAGTLVTTPRGQQAQVAAATVVDFAGVIGHCQRKEVEGSWLPTSFPDCEGGSCAF